MVNTSKNCLFMSSSDGEIKQFSELNLRTVVIDGMLKRKKH